MLPTRGICLPKETEEHLKRLKLRTKVTPNVSSRLAFFTSVESGYRYKEETLDLNGSLRLDKVTWLGELACAIESTLQMLYPQYSDPKDFEKAWADHVRDGVTKMRSAKTLVELF